MPWCDGVMTTPEDIAKKINAQTLARYDAERKAEAAKEARRARLLDERSSILKALADVGSEKARLGAALADVNGRLSEDRRRK